MALTTWGAIFVGDYLEAPDLQAAIVHCHNIMRQESARQTYGDLGQRDAPLPNQRRSRRCPSKCWRLSGVVRMRKTDEELLALVHETQRLLQTISDPAISKRLVEIVEELLELSNIGG